MEYCINSCYENYQTFCRERNIQPVTPDKYRRIFAEEFNIGFKTSKSDARDCQTCDKLKVQLKDAEVTGDERKLKFLKQERQLHQRKAQARHKKMSESAGPNDVVITLT